MGPSWLQGAQVDPRRPQFGSNLSQVGLQSDPKAVQEVPKSVPRAVLSAKTQEVENRALVYTGARFLGFQVVVFSLKFASGWHVGSEIGSTSGKVDPRWSKMDQDAANKAPRSPKVGAKKLESRFWTPKLGPRGAQEHFRDPFLKSRPHGDVYWIRGKTPKSSKSAVRVGKFNTVFAQAQ